MGAKSRRKGAQGERELVALARGLGFDGAKRTAPMQAGGYGIDFADVGGVPGLAIESKRYKRVPVNRLAPDALKPRADGLIPVLAYRDDGQPWRAVVDAQFFLALWKEVNDLRGAVAMVAQGTGVRA